MRIGAEKAKLSGEKLLLGEGDEEDFLFSSLVEHLSLVGIQALSYGGTGEIRRKLEVLKNDPDFPKVKAIGITRDADRDPGAAFQGVRSALRAAQFPVPDAPGGFTAGPLRVGVLIIPSDRPGMLETLCLESVADDGAMPCVDRFFECVKAGAHREPSNPWKARVHAWLSSKEESHLRLGEAAKRGYWNLDHPAFEPLRSFIGRL
jgi:hypothetical protein